MPCTILRDEVHRAVLRFTSSGHTASQAMWVIARIRTGRGFGSPLRLYPLCNAQLYLRFEYAIVFLHYLDILNSFRVLVLTLDLAVGLTDRLTVDRTFLFAVPPVAAMYQGYFVTIV